MVKKFKGMILYGLCAVMLSVGIGCCVGLLKNEKTYAQSVTVSDFSGLSNALMGDADNIIVGGDINFSSTLQIGRNVKITSNGNFVLSRAGGFDGTMIVVEKNASVELSSLEGNAISFDGQNLEGKASAILNNGALTLGENVSVKNFKGAVDGVAIDNYGTLNLCGGKISNNTLEESSKPGVDVYGIVYNRSKSTFNIESGEIFENTSAPSGMIFMYNNSKLNMTGGKIHQNQSTLGGAFFFKSCDAKLSGGEISNNSVSKTGGAIYAKDSARVVLDGVDIASNSATTYGGAIYAIDDASFLMKSGKIFENSAQTGGAIFLTKASDGSFPDGTLFEMQGGEVFSNTAKNNGGAFIVKSKLKISGGTVNGNYLAQTKTKKGGAIYAYDGGRVEISGGELSGNSAYQGGAICADYDSIVTVTGGQFSSNVASYRGNDIYGTGDTTKTPVYSVVELLGGSLENVDMQYSALRLGGDLSVSGQITEFASVKADYGYFAIASELKNSIAIKLYSSAKVETSSTANNFLRNEIDEAADPYSNIYRALNKITYTDETKTQEIVDGKILLVASANKIETIASEYAVEVKKSATDGETVEMNVIKEYSVSNLKVTDTSGNAIAVSQNGNKYSFVMPTESGVKINYDAQRKVLPISVEASAGEFVQVAATAKFEDVVTLQIKNVEGKKLDSIFVGNGTYSKELDLANPQFVMFDGATISVSYREKYAVTAKLKGNEDYPQIISKVEFESNSVAVGDVVKFRIEQNKDPMLSRYSLNAVYYLDRVSQKVVISKDINGVYSFVMPAYDVEVGFEFVDILEGFVGEAIIVSSEQELVEALKRDNVAVMLGNDITISNTLKIVEGNHSLLSLNGSSLKRGADFKGNMIEIGFKTALNLGFEGVGNSFIIDGQNVEDTTGSIIYVEDSGVVNMYDGVVIKNNKETAVYNYNGIFNMYGGQITDNSASGNGGGVNNQGRFNLYGGEISNNSAEGAGGAVYNARVFNQAGGDILNNTSATYGGGVYVNNSFYAYYYLVSGKVSGNTGKSSGGAIFIAEKGSVFIKGGEISQNRATNNGGVVNCKGTLFVFDGLISGNTAGSKGGAIHLYGKGRAFVRGGTFTENTAKYGGAICASDNSTVEVSNCEIFNNSGATRGGGIYALGDKDKGVYATITLKNVYIHDNTSSEGAQVCIQYAVLELGKGVEVVGGITTVANPTASYGFVSFVETIDTPIQITPNRYADYEQEQFNVLRVANGADASAIAEKLTIAKKGSTEYTVKVDGQNLYIQTKAVA